MNQSRSGSDQRQTNEPPAAAQRLAAVLGWERVPELSEEQAREAEAKLAAAQAEARRVYGLDEAA
jgi:hypothetical protein